MRKLGLAFLLMFVVCTVHAQFSDSTHYYFKYGSTGSVNKTQDGASYLLNNGLTFKVSKKNIVLNADMGYIFGKQDDARTNSDFSASLNFNLYPGEERRFYYWG